MNIPQLENREPETADDGTVFYKLEDKIFNGKISYSSSQALMDVGRFTCQETPIRFKTE